MNNIEKVALRITNRIKLDQSIKREMLIGNTMSFNGMVELNCFINTKSVTREEFAKMYPKGDNNENI